MIYMVNSSDLTNVKISCRWERCPVANVGETFYSYLMSLKRHKAAHFLGVSKSFCRHLVGLVTREIGLSPASSYLFVRLPACINSAQTGRIFVKFDVGDFHENLSRQIPKCG